ncbi:MAG TPA: sulfotransferase [Steroidobacteraceae bacterium]|nr:sulfotransferase [Steroidobacteraceae bacterium]
MTDIDDRYAQAVRALRSAQPRQAEIQLLDLLADGLEEVNTRRLLGLAQLAQDRIEEATENLERAVALAPDFRHARTDLARAYRRLGRPRDALILLKQVLHAAPDLHGAWLALGDVLVDLQRYPEAASAFGRARQTDPQRTRLAAARTALARGDSREAESEYRSILHADPGCIGALCGLASICVQGGFVAEAERLLRHALRQAQHDPLIWRRLNETLIEAGRLDEAEAAIRRTLLLIPDDAESYIALGNTCARLLKAPEALAAYQEAERLNPARKLVHLSIGHLLKTLGRRAECERVYHECLTQEPASGEAYWSLADLKNYHFTPAEVAAMESHLAAGTGGENNAALLHFALGRAHEQSGRDRSAFQHYLSGNSLRGRQSPFDIGAFETKCRRVRESLDRPFFEGLRDAGHSDPAPIFIVGLPRSGSTLVEQILASHSQVEATMELPHLLQYVGEFDSLDSQRDAYPESLRSAPAEVAQALGRRYLRETRPLRHGRLRFIDKLPNNFLHIGLIHAILPNATIIDVRRHPMDACFSCFKQYFAAGQSFTYDLEVLGRYYRAYLEVMDHWDRVLPHRVFHLSYEGLVAEPEAVVRNLLAHCRLPYEPQCLAFHETRRPIRTASSEQVRQPLYASGIGYWRRFEADLEPLRRSLGDCLDRFEVPSAAQATPVAPVALWPRASTLALTVGSILYGASSVRNAALAADSAGGLEEVIVTARKIEENIQDVPQSLNVFTRREMEQLDISQFEDYALRAPSIDYISLGPGQQRFFMRGVSDGSNPNFANTNTATTGFLVDDLSFNYQGLIPDIHTYDIERIEVLNGPQGTLYGGGSMSGAVRVITRKPDPDGFSAGADFNGGRIDNGGNNDSYEAFVNLPLVPGSSALRLSAFDVHQGGFIDNVLATRHWINGTTSTTAPWARNDFNTETTIGARLAFRQELPHDWTLDVSGFYQRELEQGEWQEDPRYGSLNLARFAPTGGFDYLRFLDVHTEGDVGIGNIVYALGYWSDVSRKLYDYSEYAQYSAYANSIQGFACTTGGVPSSPTYGGCNVPYMYAEVNANRERWSNELRLQSHPGGRAHWVLGAYWEKTVIPYSGFIHMPGVKVDGAAAQYFIHYYGPATPLPTEYYSIFARSDYVETTQFGDLNFDLNPHWNIEAGVEHFHSGRVSDIDWNAAFYQEKLPSRHQTSSHKNNFKGGLSYKPDERTLLYLSYAEGFRDGGDNALPPRAPASIPRYYQPDTLRNYELGWKLTWWDARVRWNGAVYYMRWVGYQVPIYDPTIASFSFNANIGDARIYGSESSLEFEPVGGLHFSVSGSYNDARLVSNKFQNPDVLILPGERLPFSPYLNAAGSVRYERALNRVLRGFAQFDVSHKGDTWNDLTISDSGGFHRFLQPAYDIGSLRVGVNPAEGNWQVEGYISNMWNKHAIVFANYTGYSHPQVVNEPRVFGVRIKYRWGKKE